MWRVVKASDYLVVRRLPVHRLRSASGAGRSVSPEPAAGAGQHGRMGPPASPGDLIPDRAGGRMAAPGGEARPRGHRLPRRRPCRCAISSLSPQPGRCGPEPPGQPGLAGSTAGTGLGGGVRVGEKTVRRLGCPMATRFTWMAYRTMRPAPSRRRVAWRGSPGPGGVAGLAGPGGGVMGFAVPGWCGGARWAGWRRDGVRCAGVVWRGSLGRVVAWRGSLGRVA